MASVDAQQTPQAGEWKKKESFRSALIQILLVGAILGGAVFFFYKRLTTGKAVADVMKDARSLAVRDNSADLTKALKLLDDAFAKDANSAEASALAAALHTELALVHKVPGEEAKAKEYLAKAEAGDAKSEDRYGTKALLMIAEGKSKEADEFIEGLRKKGATSPKLSFAQGLAQKNEGNLRLARTLLLSAADKAWKDPMYTCGLGEAALQESAFPQALDAFNKALSSNPEHQLARLGASTVKILRRVNVKDAQDAFADLSTKEDLTPGVKARVLALKAELLSFETRYDDAIAAAEEALKANPDEGWALFAKARALGMKKDASAQAAFDSLVSKFKAAPLFYFEGAALLQANGSLDQALALLDKYEAQFKAVRNQAADGKEESYLDRDDRYWLARGDVLLAANKMDEAMSSYDKAIAAKNVNQVRAHYAKGAVYVARKDYDKAAEVLTDITPSDGTGQLPEAYIAMGEVLFAKKDYGTGIQNYGFALMRMKNAQAPREQLNALITDVEKRLNSVNARASDGKPASKLWADEAKKLIQ